MHGSGALLGCAVVVASDFGSFQDAVSARTGQVLQYAKQRHADIGPETVDVLTVAQQLVRGGKRLRAGFAYLGWISTGTTAPAEPLERVAAGLELFHLAALVHDDLIDGSECRRGEPAAHLQFARRHTEHELIGSSDQFGAAGAVLLGDLLVVLATTEMFEAIADLPADHARVARQVVADMMREVTLGQYLDIFAQQAPWPATPQTDIDRAHRVLRSKSARYSVEQPLLLGTAIAGGGEDHARRASAYGLPLGEAFQLRDDLLGVFGDPELTGKPSGDDLREGKRTVLISTALQRAGEADAERLRSINGGQVEPADLEEARAILINTGAVQEIEDLIDALVARSTEAIETSGWPPAAQTLAEQLIRAATVRTG